VLIVLVACGCLLMLCVLVVHWRLLDVQCITCYCCSLLLFYCVVCFCCLLVFFCYVLLMFIGIFLLCVFIVHQHLFTMHSCRVFLVFVGASFLSLSTFLTFGAFCRLFFVHSCCSSMLSYYAFLVSLVLLRLVLPFAFFCVCVEKDKKIQFQGILYYFV
jgi:hypothetical protein